MAIKNYTSQVSVKVSLEQIQTALLNNGARKIMIDYDTDGKPQGVAFGIIGSSGQPMGFQLPANIEGVLSAFARQKIRVNAEQAARTAWRNIRDWVLAQMAFIEAGNVEMEEVFLPYLTDKSGRTLYQAYKGGQLRLGDGEYDD